MLAIKNNKVNQLSNLLRFYSSQAVKHASVPKIKSSLFKDLDKDELDPDTQTPDYVRLTLRSHVYDAIDETPITRATNLSQRYNTNVFLKREDLQPVFSFNLEIML